jgi:hypothetical protein
MLSTVGELSTFPVFREKAAEIILPHTGEKEDQPSKENEETEDDRRICANTSQKRSDHNS